jgi:hypothetical protein
MPTRRHTTTTPEPGASSAKLASRQPALVFSFSSTVGHVNALQVTATDLFVFVQHQGTRYPIFP